MGTQNQYVNYSAYLNCQTCKTFSFIRCITKSKEKLSPDHNCLHAMIDLLNKSPLIKAQVTASVNLPHFVSFVKQQCFRRYEYFFNVNDCYVCNGN